MRTTRQGTTRRSGLAAVVAVAVLAVAPAAARAGDRSASGTWQQLVNCGLTSYDLSSKHLTCVGSSLWRGTFVGVTSYKVDATYDLLTGDGHGSIDEVFRGRSDTGRRGTLRFAETFTATGSTEAMHIDARSVSGTGGFAHARATLTFDGVDNIATGSGTYVGRWRPRASR